MNPCPPPRFDLAFAPQVNEYNGRRTVQLKSPRLAPALAATPWP